MRWDSDKLIGSLTQDNQDSDGTEESINSMDAFMDSEDAPGTSDSSDSETDSDTDLDTENETNTCTDNQRTTDICTGEGSVPPDEAEDDEVVKAIMRSKEMHTNHPPPISTEDHIVDICFHPQNNIIAVATITGDVLMYKYTNTETELISTIELHLKACRDIEYNDEGSTLFSTAKDLSIMLTDVETEKLKRLYENAHEHPVYTMTVIGENMFATGDDNGVVKLWDLRQRGNTPAFSLKEMEDYVSAIITNRDAKYLVCASGDGSLTTINIPGKKLYVQSEAYDEELTCLGLFKFERKLLTASSKGKMYIFNWGEFGLHSDEFPSFTKNAINCMIPITENVVITGGEDGILRATSLFPHHHLGVVGQHSLSIEALDVNNDGTLIASSSHNNDIKFWNVKYFEALNVTERVKGGKQKQIKYNLPSSKVDNASDFFADL